MEVALAESTEQLLVVTKEETQVESMVLLMVGKMAARLVAGLEYQKVELTVDYMVEKMVVMVGQMAE